MQVHVFDKREVKDCQAIRILACDSYGVEPTIVKLFVAMNLSSTQGAQKSVCEAWVMAGCVAGGVA